MRKLWMGLALGGLLLAGCGKQSEIETLPEPVPAATPSDEAGDKAPATMPADHAGMNHEVGEATEGQQGMNHEMGHGAEEHASATADADKADICPVEHGQIKGKTSYADYNGTRYYFCCAGCVKAFLESPDKIIADHPEWAAKWSEKVPG